MSRQSENHVHLAAFMPQGTGNCLWASFAQDCCASLGLRSTISDQWYLPGHCDRVKLSEGSYTSEQRNATLIFSWFVVDIFRLGQRKRESCLGPCAFAHSVQAIILGMKGIWFLSAQHCSTFGSIMPAYFQMHIPR